MGDDAYAWCFELQIFLHEPVKAGDFGGQDKDQWGLL